MCVKPADLTTHSPPKPFARPRTATRPSRALPRAPAAPMHARRLRDAFPAEALRSPPQRHALPEHFRSPTQRRRTPAGCAMHARRPHNAFPAEDLRSPTHSDTPFPSTSAPPRSPDARPQTARCTPADLTTHSPPKTSPRPRTATRPSRALPLAHAVPMHAHKLRYAFPADLTTHSPPKICSHPAQRRALPEHFLTPFPRTSAPPPRDDARPPPSQPIPRRRSAPAPHSDTPSPKTSARPRSTDARPQAARCIPRSATLSLLPFRFGHKKTAPHSACAMPNVSVDRRCGRSFGLVSRALFAAVAGRWRVGVGLRPQPWALRSRRCGRVLLA